MKDELRKKYDLKSLQVRKLGREKKSFGKTTVRLEPDVAEMFPTADIVNEGLRFSIGVLRDNQADTSTEKDKTSLERTDKNP